MIQEIINNFTVIGYAISIFICAYMSNVAFSLWYNIKKLKQPFKWGKIKDGFLKIAVFIIGLMLLCASITLMPDLANRVGWAMAETYTQTINDIAIVAAFLAITCKYIKEAYEKLMLILQKE